MFDATLNVMSVHTDAPTQEQIDQGANPEVIMSIVPGIVLPLADPANPTEPVVVPGGQFRIRLDGEAAVTIGTRLAEQGKALPPRRPKIEVAASLAGADEAARRLAELRG